MADGAPCRNDKTTATMNNTFKIALAGVVLLLAACGTKKAAVQGGGKTDDAQLQTADKPSAGSSFAFVQKVNDNRVDAQNIVADMTFTATMGDKEVSVPGSLHMRRDKVIRLQLFIPILRSEVGRLEFTPDYVLVIDRMHKQYVKEDYNKLDFLRANGLNFYSLQALFWNQLFVPGTRIVDDTMLSKFKAVAGSGAQDTDVTLTAGNMSYRWTANSLSGLIGSAVIAYTSAASGKSTLEWKYSNFKSVGARMFPAGQQFTFQTTSTAKLQKVTVDLDMDTPSTSDKWDTETTVSSKYKKMEASDIVGKLFKM